MLAPANAWCTCGHWRWDLCLISNDQNGVTPWAGRWGMVSSSSQLHDPWWCEPNQCDKQKEAKHLVIQGSLNGTHLGGKSKLMVTMSWIILRLPFCSKNSIYIVWGLVSYNDRSYLESVLGVWKYYPSYIGIIYIGIIKIHVFIGII